MSWQKKIDTLPIMDRVAVQAVEDVLSGITSVRRSASIAPAQYRELFSDAVDMTNFGDPRLIRLGYALQLEIMLTYSPAELGQMLHSTLRSLYSMLEPHAPRILQPARRRPGRRPGRRR
jgi:hypothetical protein